MQRFDGRVALVTGGAHGIGRATAARLASEGASVAIADLDTEAAQKTADELTSADQIMALPCDVTDRESVDAAMAAVVERFGGLDVLVNNVGINGGPQFEDMDEAEWYRQLDPTLYGAVRCIKAALPMLLAARDGASVVSIGSVNGIAAFGNEAYSAAKAGLVNLTENLALRYGRHGVRFNLVAPATIHTRHWHQQFRDDPELLEMLGDLYPLGRIGQPEDIAAAVAYLASDDAAWVTGTVLRVDGGILAGAPSFLAAMRGHAERRNGR
ncbi:SDR family NAD(P)-dependent oxidoreductase [Phytoactinopolyspora mesophila]|uniref:Glucose 1-dehydrogenase n=1 Tax=Phytoactinopolyspora mesophila TaxID=2650750 RepID=A0A7K3M6K3_9ACTN|nr:SDR family oxidoreductase [Phytoactinopolyspora mesophila]NDL58522.1 glucose 1-dehydrogenase [Phytoactinopolyspora mesophila]